MNKPRTRPWSSLGKHFLFISLVFHLKAGRATNLSLRVVKLCSKVIDISMELKNGKVLRKNCGQLKN
jgi:RecA-family ATPase